MPDKRYKRGCGRRCLKCWQNKMKHGCKLSGDVRTKNYNVCGDKKKHCYRKKRNYIFNTWGCNDIYKSYIIDRIEGLDSYDMIHEPVITNKNKSNIIHLDDLYLDFMYWYYINNSELPKMNKQTIIEGITYYISKVQMKRKIIYNVKFIEA